MQSIAFNVLIVENRTCLPFLQREFQSHLSFPSIALNNTLSPEDIGIAQAKALDTNQNVG